MDLRNCLIINPGSSSLKWEWFSDASNKQGDEFGKIQLSEFKKLLNTINNKHSIRDIVIRFVSGCGMYNKPIQLSEPMIEYFEASTEHAPLHNPISALCARTAFSLLASQTRIFAVFDSQYFENLPSVAKLIPVSASLTRKYSLRRFGYHGFAHSGMSAFADQQLRKQCKSKISNNFERRVITIQIGSGCSIAAVKNGVPIDTSMGFTPNDGLIMSTRSGYIEPGLVTWLQKKEGWSTEQTDQILNYESGWNGISEESDKFTDLLTSDSAQSLIATQILSYQIKKFIGSYFAVLGGIDALVFGGGIAENAPWYCQSIVSDLEHLGFTLNKSVKVEEPISNDAIELSESESRVACWIVNNQESKEMLKSIINEFYL